MKMTSILFLSFLKNVHTILQQFSAHSIRNLAGLFELPPCSVATIEFKAAAKKAAAKKAAPKKAAKKASK